MPIAERLLEIFFRYRDGFPGACPPMTKEWPDYHVIDVCVAECGPPSDGLTRGDIAVYMSKRPSTLCLLQNII